MKGSGVNALKEQAGAFWAARAPRERVMLSVGIAAVLLTIVYLALINPALTGRAQLQKSLPQLRQQAAELQGLSHQAAQLNAAGSAPVPPLTRETIEAGLGRRNIKPQSVLVSGDMIKIQLQGAPFSGVVGWLDEMQKTARTSLTEGTMEAQGGIDTVNATLTLRQQRPEGGG